MAILSHGVVACWVLLARLVLLGQKSLVQLGQCGSGTLAMMALVAPNMPSGFHSRLIKAALWCMSLNIGTHWFACTPEVVLSLQVCWGDDEASKGTRL